MLSTQPEEVNATSLSDSVENQLWESQSDSIKEDGSRACKQRTATSEHSLHLPSESPSKDGSPEINSDIYKQISERLSQPVYEDASNLSELGDDRLYENSSNRFTNSEEISKSAKLSLEAPYQPTCRDGSSLSSISDEETTGHSENSSAGVIPSSKSATISKETLEMPSQSDSEIVTASVSLSIVPSEEVATISKNTLAPTCRDGSSLSLYSDDETALATISYASEIGSSSSESDVEEENVLSQLPRNLVAQTPQVLVDNSSDVHIGPHFQYSGPITVKQYITVKGKEAIEDDNLMSGSNVPTELPQMKEIVNVTLKPHGLEGDSKFSEVSADKNNIVLSANYIPKLSNKVPHFNNGAKINGLQISEDVLLSGSKDTLLRRKKLFRMRYILTSLVIVLILCISIALSVVLPGGDSSSDNPPKPKNINITCPLKDVRVSTKGDRTIRWLVNITSSIGKLKVDWYGPDCKLIERKDGPSKYDIPDDIYDQKNGVMQTELKVLEVTETDRGLYRLHAYNDQGEEWEYFTLRLEDGYVVACYVAEWAHQRRDQGMFTVDNIDPKVCTHLLYAFANLNTNTNIIYPGDEGYDLENGQDEGAYKEMVDLKKINPELKVLISMGGWAERTDKNYSIVADSPIRRKEFVASVVEFLKKYNFDGLDLHWQYPTEQNGVPADKQNLVYMLKELREAFDKEGKNWLLTLPLGLQPNTLVSYIIPEINKHVHYMFPFAYAYHGHWNGRTGPNAPLKRSKAGDELNVDASIRKLLRLGADAGKLVLGLPLYGRGFILANEADNDHFGGRSSNGFTGPFVQELGFLGYNEICMELVEKYSNWKVHWDDETHTPFATNGKKFISYDNERSLKEKVEYALSKNLAGVVSYSLDTDDFRGVCASENSGEPTYPLMRAVNEAFLTASFGPKEPCRNAYRHNVISNEVK